MPPNQRGLLARVLQVFRLRRRGAETHTVMPYRVAGPALLRRGPHRADRQRAMSGSAHLQHEAVGLLAEPV